MPQLIVRLDGHIDAPTGYVWDGLTDLGAVDEWLDRVDESTAAGVPLPGERAGDTRWRIGRRWIAGGLIEIRPGRRLVLLVREAGSLIRQLRVAIDLSQAERGTDFHLELSAEAPAAATPLLPWLRFRAEAETRRAVRGFRSWLGDRLAVERRAGRRDGGVGVTGRSIISGTAPVPARITVAEPIGIGVSVAHGDGAGPAPCS